MDLEEHEAFGGICQNLNKIVRELEKINNFFEKFSISMDLDDAYEEKIRKSK